MKRQDVVFLIVENGGERSVRIKNEDGKTPLDLAKDMAECHGGANYSWLMLFFFGCLFFFCKSTLAGVIYIGVHCTNSW